MIMENKNIEPALSIAEIARDLKLEFLAGSDFRENLIKVSDLKRPGLELTGFWKHFVPERIHLLGKTEISYLEELSRETRKKRLKKFYSFNPAAVIITRAIDPPPDLIEFAKQAGIPVLRTEKPTTKFISLLSSYLEENLAPRKIIHGVLVDIYGMGVLLRGKSGIGKSETAIALVKRGHRMVADDVIEVKSPGGQKLIGSAPEATRYFLEMRGIGIINVKTLFGAGAVRNSISLDLVVRLETWQEGQNYERLGLQKETDSIMGVEVPRLLLPVRPGRNLALVLEVAAMNHRLNSMNYNAAENLLERINNRR